MKVKTANIYVIDSGGIRLVLLELLTGDGLVGLGEAGLAYGLGGQAAAAMLRERPCWQRLGDGLNTDGLGRWMRAGS